MNVLLVNPPIPKALHSFQRAMQMMQVHAMAPPLGLLTVAGLLPKEWELKLVELSFQTISDEEWDYVDLLMVTGTVLQCMSSAEMRILGKVTSGEFRVTTYVYTAITSVS